MKKIGVGALLIFAALTGTGIAGEVYDPARSFRERIGGENLNYQRPAPQDFSDQSMTHQPRHARDFYANVRAE